MRPLDLRAEARAVNVALPPKKGLVTSAIATWRGRMINEYASSAVFEGLAEQLGRAGATAAEIKAVSGFALEEKRHGVLCGAVVEALGGEAKAEIPNQSDFPSHDDVSALEGSLRNVLSIGCLSETVAVSLIGAEREEMPEGELRDLLTKIWADEIGHARFGWRMVANKIPSLDAQAKLRLSAYLRIAFRHLEEHEISHLPDSGDFGPAGAALGLCSGRDARVLFYSTVEKVIVPRLDSLGLKATLAWSTRARLAA